MTLSERTIKSLQLICPVCKKPFTKKRHRQRLCSPECTIERNKQIRLQRQKVKEANKHLKSYAYFLEKEKKLPSISDHINKRNLATNQVRVGSC